MPPGRPQLVPSGSLYAASALRQLAGVSDQVGLSQSCPEFAMPGNEQLEATLGVQGSLENFWITEYRCCATQHCLITTPAATGMVPQTRRKCGAARDRFLITAIKPPSHELKSFHCEAPCGPDLRQTACDVWLLAIHFRPKRATRSAFSNNLADRLATSHHSCRVATWTRSRRQNIARSLLELVKHATDKHVVCKVRFTTC